MGGTLTDSVDFLARNWVEVVGYIGAALTLAAYSMRRILPLRVVAVAANVAFIAYGYLAPAYPQLVLHAALLPLNAYRIADVLRQMREARAAATEEFSVDWLRPYMSVHEVTAGEVVFRKGEAAEAMYYVEDGAFRLREIGKRIGPGTIVGEIAFLVPEGGRTLTLECVDDGSLLELTYPKLAELYYENPNFGLYLMRLTGRRLLHDIRRLESIAASA